MKTSFYNLKVLEVTKAIAAQKEIAFYTSIAAYHGVQCIENAIAASWKNLHFLRSGF